MVMVDGGWHGGWPWWMVVVDVVMVDVVMVEDGHGGWPWWMVVVDGCGGWSWWMAMVDGHGDLVVVDLVMLGIILFLRRIAHSPTFPDLSCVSTQSFVAASLRIEVALQSSALSPVTNFAHVVVWENFPKSVSLRRVVVNILT